jgi:S1-C subfamily serine protease
VKRRLPSKRSAGLKRGDVVEEIERRKVKSVEEFRKIIQVLKISDRVTLRVWSSGKEAVLTVTMGEMP